MGIVVVAGALLASLLPQGAGVTANDGGGMSAAGQPSYVAELPDPEERNSFPERSGSTPHRAAVTPATAGRMRVAPGAPSDAQVRRELDHLQALARQVQAPIAGTSVDGVQAPMPPGVQAQTGASAPAGAAAPAGAIPSADSVGGAGTVVPAPGTPAAIARVIAGGDAIATFPYRWGGGHLSFVDDAYDCSGSVSYALAAGGLLSVPLTSGQLEQWGAPGPGRWITVYANAGHVYMYVAGMRFDTSGRSGVFGSRWQTVVRSNDGFIARHWPGL